MRETEWNLQSKKMLIFNPAQVVAWTITDKLLSLGSEITIISQPNEQLEFLHCNWLEAGHHLSLMTLTDLPAHMANTIQSLPAEHVDIALYCANLDNLPPCITAPERVIQTHFSEALTSPIYFSNLIYNKLLAKPPGRLLFLFQLDKGPSNSSLFEVRREAIHQFTRSLAKEWLAQHIQVNTIINYEQPRNQHDTSISHQRLADLVAFLCMEESVAVNGQSFECHSCA